MLPAPSVREHCVTPARAAARYTRRELNLSLALITNFHAVNRPVLLRKKSTANMCDAYYHK